MVQADFLLFDYIIGMDNYNLRLLRTLRPAGFAGYLGRLLDFAPHLGVDEIADPYYLAVAIDSLTNAFLFLWLEAPERHPYPENPDTILDILFKGLIKPSP